MQKFKVGDRVEYEGGEYAILHIEGERARLDKPEELRNSVTWYSIHLLSTITPQPQTVYAVCDENGKVVCIGDTEKEVWANFSDMPNSVTPAECGMTIRPFHLIPVNE